MRILFCFLDRPTSKYPVLNLRLNLNLIFHLSDV